MTVTENEREGERRKRGMAAAVCGEEWRVGVGEGETDSAVMAGGEKEVPERERKPIKLLHILCVHSTYREGRGQISILHKKIWPLSLSIR